MVEEEEKAPERGKVKDNKSMAGWSPVSIRHKKITKDLGDPATHADQGFFGGSSVVICSTGQLPACRGTWLIRSLPSDLMMLLRLVIPRGKSLRQSTIG